MKNHENRANSNTKSLSNKLTVLKVSPTKNCSGAIRKTKDFKQTVKEIVFVNFVSKQILLFQYSILKKPRLDLVSNLSSAGCTMKPLASNMVFNGFGGSERVDPFDHALSSDDDCRIGKAKEQNESKQKPASTSSLNTRFKSGGLRNFKLTK